MKSSSITKSRVSGGWEIRGYTSPIKAALIEGGAVWESGKVRWFYAGDNLPKVIRDAIKGLSSLDAEAPEITPTATPIHKAPVAAEIDPVAPHGKGVFANGRYQATGRVTPLRQQYLDIKAQYPDSILFFRLGDFYETFDRDAEIAAQELDLVLTNRPVSKSERVPMVGVPHHALDEYIARLIEKGYSVAVAEQASEPDGRGIVERAVTRTITPESHDRMADVLSCVGAGY